jgi:hypothetical protein
LTDRAGCTSHVTHYTLLHHNSILAAWLLIMISFLLLRFASHKKESDLLFATTMAIRIISRSFMIIKAIAQQDPARAMPMKRGTANVVRGGQNDA